MRVTAALAVALLLLGDAATGAPQYQGEIRLGWPDSGGAVTASLPDTSWVLEITAPGFVVERNEMMPDGRRYVLAHNRDSGVVVSVYLERVPREAKHADCAQYLRNWIASNGEHFQIKNVRPLKLGEVESVEFTVPFVAKELGNTKVQQENVVGCMAHDDVYADIHVSKMSLKPLEGSALQAVIQSAHIKDSGSAPAVSLAPNPVSGSDSEATSRHYFGLGSRYFLERRLPQAIVQYQKALELEKKERKLPRDEWRVLVDNLGMSYGMTGDLKHAEEVFQYGISQDPTYPNFYYSMACVYGERNDLENAMKYLKRAFAYKENVIAGETMPDPRRDSSFRYFMKNPRFLSLVDSLTTP